MMEGFFRMAFTGAAGSGFGMIVFHDGSIAGADVGGATYDGSYTDNQKTRTLEFQITMYAPAGMTPVQTGIPIAEPISLPFNGSISQDDLRDEKPTLLHTPLGPVNVLFKKVRDFP